MEGLHKIHFAWTGWLRKPSLELSPKPSQALCDLWEADGIRPLSWKTNGTQLNLVVAAESTRGPGFAANRIKGRWQYALKTQPGFSGFQKNFFLRTLGRNNREEATDYVRNQAVNGDFADPLFRKRFHELRYFQENDVDPLTGRRASYDLVYHVILVTAGRWRMRENEEPAVFVSELPAALEERDVTLLELSVMPDHMHLLLRAVPSLCSDDILRQVREGSGKLVRRTALWQPGGYVGSVGPYRLQTVMKRNQPLP